MRIVFLGLPLAALLLLRDGHELVLAGLRSSLTLGQRRLQRRMGSREVLVDPHRDWAGFEKKVKALSPDLLVSWFFTRRIPMSLVGCCPLGGIGVHPSLLPRYRGPDPFFAVLDRGEPETGVTVHRIGADYDTGAIIEQRSVPIDPRWNAWQLAKKLDRPSLEALRAAVRRASQGDPLLGTPQDESQATYAPQPDEPMRELHWNQPAERIIRRVRALAPSPGALAFTKDEVALLVLEAERCDKVPRALAPGEAALVEGVPVVRASDTGVALLSAEVDGQRLGPEELAKLIV